MLLNSIKVDFRQYMIINKYSELISVGVKPSEILILAQNSTLKKQLINNILEKIDVDATEQFNVHSFFSRGQNNVYDKIVYKEYVIKFY